MSAVRAAAGGLPAFAAIVAAAVAAIPVAAFVGGGGDPRIVLVLAAVAAAVAGAVRFPLVGLVGVVVVTIANVSDTLIEFHGLPSITKLIAPGLAFIVGVRWLFFGERPFLDPLAIGLLGLVSLIMAGSVVVATDWRVAADALDGHLRDMAVVVLALCFLGRAGAFRALTASMLATGAALSALGVYKHLLGDVADVYGGFSRTFYAEQRLGGPIDDPNFFGALLVCILPLAADRALWARGAPTRLYGAACAAVIGGAILLTGSRGALVAAAASGALYALALDRRTALRFAAVAAAAFVALLFAVSQTLIERLETILTLADRAAPADISVVGRLASWRVAVELFIEHPFFGVGAGNYNLHFQDRALDLGLIFRGEGRSAHSLFLELLAEQGLVGFGAFLAMLAAAALGVARAMSAFAAAGDHRGRMEAAAFGAGLAGYLFGMIFLHDSYPRFLWITIATAVALPRIARLEVARRRAGAAAPWRPRTSC